MSKILIAYYSQTGQTKKEAVKLQEKTGADIYEIVPNRTYNDDMWKAWDEAQIERKENNYPDLDSNLPDISRYDVVLIGGASWGYTLSNPVTSFIRKMDFSGKKVSAFWTFYDHDEKYDEDMKKETKNGNYIKGLPLPRTLTCDRNKTSEEMDKWLKTIL